jgi:hypothetical protein
MLSHHKNITNNLQNDSVSAKKTDIAFASEDGLTGVEAHSIARPGPALPIFRSNTSNSLPANLHMSHTYQTRSIEGFSSRPENNGSMFTPRNVARINENLAATNQSSRDWSNYNSRTMGSLQVSLKNTFSTLEF